MALLSNSPCDEVAKTKKAMIRGQRQPIFTIKVDIMNIPYQKNHLVESFLSEVNTGENPISPNQEKLRATGISA